MGGKEKRKKKRGGLCPEEKGKRLEIIVKMSSETCSSLGG